MKTKSILTRRLLLLFAATTSVLLSAAHAPAQYTFGPEIQSTLSANITYSSGTFQYTDSANASSDFAALPLAGTAATLITTSSNWTASLSVNLSQRTMTATGADELSVGMGLVIQLNGSVNNIVYVALEQRNATGVANYNLYGNGVVLTAQNNGQNIPTTSLGGSELQNNGTSLLYLPPIGSATGPATETNSAVSGVLTLEFNKTSDTLIAFYNGAPVGSISLTNWSGQPSLTLDVLGLSGGGIAVSAGTDTATNFSVTGSLSIPTVQFIASPTSGLAPLAVQFNSTNVDSAGNTITSWNWNFGDGSTTNIQNPLHTYTNFGTFYPSFIATNSHNVAAIGYGPQVTILTPTSATNFTFITNNSAITITGYIGTNTVVVIPPNINGLPVVSVGDEAFWECWRLTNVTIPNSVTNIGFLAFCGCSSLNSVTIPISVVNIGAAAFDGCSSLIDVTIPSGVISIGGGAFFRCSELVEAIS